MNFFQKNRYTLIRLGVVCLTLIYVGLRGVRNESTLAEGISAKAKKDGTIKVLKNDAEMEMAFAKARDTLDDFLKTASNPPIGSKNFILKVPVIQGDIVEYFWIEKLIRNGDVFTGYISNTPNSVKNIEKGKILTFTRTEIYDWSNSVNSTRFGDFTTCVLLSRETQEEQIKFRNTYGLNCSR